MKVELAEISSDQPIISGIQQAVQPAPQYGLLLEWRMIGIVKELKYFRSVDHFLVQGFGIGLIQVDSGGIGCFLNSNVAVKYFLLSYFPSLVDDKRENDI